MFFILFKYLYLGAHASVAGNVEDQEYVANTLAVQLKYMWWAMKRIMTYIYLDSWSQRWWKVQLRHKLSLVLLIILLSIEFDMKMVAIELTVYDEDLDDENVFTL